MNRPQMGKISDVILISFSLEYIQLNSLKMENLINKLKEKKKLIKECKKEIKTLKKEYHGGDKNPTVSCMV